MTKILVVDDETDLELLIKQKFRRKIRDGQYEFVFAINGVQALAQLEVHDDVMLILSDINMPEMDGLTLLSKLNDKHTLLKSVMVSAYGDMDNIRMAMNLGAFDFVTKPIDFKDLELTIEKTIKHVTQLRETVQALKENDILKMYVDETVLNFMGSREHEASLMANELIEATVVFIDICGFTKLSEKETPDNVVHLLNNYFDLIVTEIIGHGGSIDKFMGDCVMAIFRDQHHLDRAIDACLEVRNKIKTLPQASEQISYVPSVSIGLNSGEMISGNIGSAKLKRLDFTVIGDVVNTAQRLQSAAQGGQIVINESAYQRIKESFRCEPIGEISLKNKALPMMAYAIME